MGVVTVYGNGFPTPGALTSVDGIYAEGMTRMIGSTIAVANGDSANSLHYFGRVPSNAIILPSSVLYHGSITTLADYDVGIFADGAAAVSGSEDILADGLDLSSAGSKSAVNSVALADQMKRVWELLGLSSDPGRFYDIVGTMKAASTAASSIQAFIYYAKRG